MQRSFIAFLLLALLPFAVSAREKIVAYVPNWVDLQVFAESIDYAKLTHINIAFENPLNDKGELSFNPKNDFLIRKAHDNNVKVLVSIGGGAASGDAKLKSRYFDLLTDNKRVDFAEKLSKYVEEHHFDGLDVDIEGPAINKDYGPFILDLFIAMKPRNQLLTAALSQGYGGRNVPDGVFEFFDFINVMAYDGAGPWDPKSPGQHSSFEMAKNSVAHWIGRGLPAEKTVLGVPFYGYGFGAAFRKRDYTYASIVAEFSGAENLDQGGDTIWYNGIPTIKAKTRFAIDQNLGGIMIWSLDLDAKGEKSLLSAISETYKSTPASGRKGD